MASKLPIILCIFGIICSCIEALAPPPTSLSPIQHHLISTKLSASTLLTSTSVGNRLAINENYPGLKRIHSNPDVFVIEGNVRKGIALLYKLLYLWTCFVNLIAQPHFQPSILLPERFSWWCIMGRPNKKGEGKGNVTIPRCVCRVDWWYQRFTWTCGIRSCNLVCNIGCLVWSPGWW